MTASDNVSQWRCLSDRHSPKVVFKFLMKSFVTFIELSNKFLRIGNLIQLLNVFSNSHFCRVNQLAKIPRVDIDQHQHYKKILYNENLKLSSSSAIIHLRSHGSHSLIREQRVSNLPRISLDSHTKL